MRVRKLCCGILLLLVACAGGEPVSQSTSYILPATPGGRMCVDQCNKSRDYCQESCTLDYRACYNDIQASAQHAYDAYVRDRFANHAPITLLPSDFEHPDLCDAEKKHCFSDCDHPYNSCYSDCGGSVIVTSSCRFLCFE